MRLDISKSNVLERTKEDEHEEDHNITVDQTSRDNQYE